MNTTTAYTPLESLLLFQSLAVSGTDPDVFIQTSTLLKSNLLIREGETYDPGRLSPDALRELYLQLLREELRLEALQNEGKGDASPSRKRKLQTPPIPTIREGLEYSEKLPKLVDRLYERYRDYMIALIREDERKYEALQSEMAEVARGEWDERLQKDDRSKSLSQRSPSVTAEDSRSSNTIGSSPLPVTAVLPETQATESTTGTPQVEEQKPQRKPTPPPILPPRKEPKPEGLAINDVLNSREPSPPKATEPASASPAENGPSILPPLPHQRASSQDRLPGPSPLQPAQQMPPENLKWEQFQGAPMAAQPPPSSFPHNYAQFSPQHYPYATPPPRGSFPGHVPLSPHNNAGPHPIVLPPPNMGRGPGSPATRHLDQLADVAEQQYRAPSASPLMQQGPLQQGQMPQRSIEQGQMQLGTMQPGPIPGAQFVQPYEFPPRFGSDGRPIAGSGIPPQWPQQYIAQSRQPPNYSHPPPTHVQRPFPAIVDKVQPEQRLYSSPYIHDQQPRPIVPSSSTSTPKPLHLRGHGSLPHTPASYSLPQHSTGKATRWTPNLTSSTPKAPKSPIQPAFEPLSPILPTAKPVKLPRGVGRPRKSEGSSAAQPRTRGQRGTKRRRAGSTASPVRDEPHRSQSVMSHADELSLVNDSISGLIVKQESATPRMVDDIGDTTADESSQRRLRGTVPASPLRVSKRKRSESPHREPSGPPTHVLWTRNFPKITAYAIDRISAHRNASTFALPIKERDAPGYKNLILQPQDLKSIRAAINTGYKSGLAKVSTTDDHVQAGVSLPISEDLIPPKGIVNNAQLEKELMRMFANAIMFNHDPNRSLGPTFEAAPSIEESGPAENYQVDENGLVHVTRAMFADVEKIVGELRSAERRKGSEAVGDGEEEEVDTGTGEGETTVGSVAKRRRRA